MYLDGSMLMGHVKSEAEYQDWNLSQIPFIFSNLLFSTANPQSGAYLTLPIKADRTSAGDVICIYLLVILRILKNFTNEGPVILPGLCCPIKC